MHHRKHDIDMQPSLHAAVGGDELEGAADDIYTKSAQMHAMQLRDRVRCLPSHAFRDGAGRRGAVPCVPGRPMGSRLAGPLSSCVVAPPTYDVSAPPPVRHTDPLHASPALLGATFGGSRDWLSGDSVGRDALEILSEPPAGSAGSKV